MFNIEISEEILNDIISTAYGDAPFATRRRIKSLAKSNDTVANLLEQYSNTAASVHSINEEECPREVIEKIEDLTKSRTNSRSFLSDWLSIWYSRPVMSTATGLVVVAVLVFSIFIHRPNQHLEVSSEEVRLAELQTQKALEIVGKIFAKTRSTFKNDILVEHVSKPINKGINKVNNLFNTGGTNESTIN